MTQRNQRGFPRRVEGRRRLHLPATALTIKKGAAVVVHDDQARHGVASAESPSSPRTSLT